MNAHSAQRVEHFGAPPATASTVAIVVHGRNQSPEWMREFLIDRLDMLDVAFVAPEAADNTWYPGGFMQELDDNEPKLTWALDRIDQLVGELEAAGRSRAEIFLLGFSQGACLLAEYISRHPARYGGVGVLTGGLIGPPGTTWQGASLDGTPIVIATSDIDEWVPLARAEQTRDVFENRGGAVTWRVYAGMDHIISDDEIALISTLLAPVAGQR
jgi:phospholipase/carboxylesterase